MPNPKRSFDCVSFWIGFAVALCSLLMGWYMRGLL